MKCKYDEKYRGNNMKYCKKCGAQLKDDAKFCIKCGQPTGMQNASSIHNCQYGGEQQRDYQSNGQPPKNPAGRFRKKWLGIGTVIIIVVIILAFIFNPTLRMKGYEKPVYYSMKFTESGDIKSFAKALPLKELVKYAKNKAGTLFDAAGLKLDDYKEAVESLENIMEYYVDEVEDEYGDDFRVKYEIKNAKRIKDMDDIQNNYDKLDIEVKEAYELEVKITLEGDKNKEQETSDVKVVRIGDKWYLDIFSM